MSDLDIAIVKRLVSADFPGAPELCEQVTRAMIKRRDLGTALVLEAHLPNGLRRAEVERRVPVEAEGKDLDGTVIHLLVHVVNGYLKEVEIFREDGQQIHQLPAVESLTVQVFG